jgi:poly [ADP-ribose] polymerase
MAVTQVVPLGEGVKRADVKKSSLLYNEYIVYDVSQIKARYLVQMKFNYK